MRLQDKNAAIAPRGRCNFGRVEQVRSSKGRIFWVKTQLSGRDFGRVKKMRPLEGRIFTDEDATVGCESVP